MGQIVIWTIYMKSFIVCTLKVIRYWFKLQKVDLFRPPRGDTGGSSVQIVPPPSGSSVLVTSSNLSLSLTLPFSLLCVIYYLSDFWPILLPFFQKNLPYSFLLWAPPKSECVGCTQRGDQWKLKTGHIRTLPIMAIWPGNVEEEEEAWVKVVQECSWNRDRKSC